MTIGKGAVTVETSKRWNDHCTDDECRCDTANLSLEPDNSRKINGITVVEM